MRILVSREVENGRIVIGKFASHPSDGNRGAFNIRHNKNPLFVIADDGRETGWEHVSVSLTHRTPTWDEMAYIKKLFWLSAETVVQFHPAADKYVNTCSNCLHLWRKIGIDIELPPRALVG